MVPPTNEGHSAKSSSETPVYTRDDVRVRIQQMEELVEAVVAQWREEEYPPRVGMAILCFRLLRQGHADNSPSSYQASWIECAVKSLDQMRGVLEAARQQDLNH